MKRLLAAAITLVLLTFSAPAFADCINPAGAAGKIFYNADSKVLQYCDGANWIAMHPPGSGGGGCSIVPAGSKPEGYMFYNPDHRVMQGCAGNVWKAMGLVGGGQDWVQVSIFGTHGCAIKDDGTLWCWGDNTNGKTGQNTAADVTLVPTGVTGGGVWKQVSSGNTHTCGIKSDDSLWCWGSNSNGQIGDNTSGGANDRLVPTQVSGAGMWKQVSTGQAYTCGIKSDDTLWCWGQNTSGKTGQNTTAGDTLVPTGVTGGGAWKRVNTGSVHACGIKSDDTLWCWGSNSSGATGLGTSVGNTLVPTQVSGGGAWKQVAAGVNTSCGIKSDDTLWCWGGW